MIKKLPSLADAQRAVCRGKDPLAFLQLGMIYSQGKEATRDDMLARYFIRKALDMGCQEAREYIDKEYETGKKDWAAEITCLIESASSISKENTFRLRAKVEEERKARRYGNLSSIRSFLPMLYPEYNREKAIDDILNCRDTIDADILYSTCTNDNKDEVYIPQQEAFFKQVYAPFEAIRPKNEEIGAHLLGDDVKELAQCIVNITSAYDAICNNFDIDKKELRTLDEWDYYPTFKLSDLVLLRQQGLRCLLSIKDIDPAINDKYLNNLCDDRTLLEICEKITDQDIQLFLISFVELNIDIDAIETNALKMYRAYKTYNFLPIIEHLNAIANNLKAIGLKHTLPPFAINNLPLIKS